MPTTTVRRVTTTSMLAALLAIALVVTVAAPALAHASFDVTQLPARGSVDLTLRVPLERDATNQRVEVLVPGAFSVTSCPATDGWSCRQDTTTDGDTVITLEREPNGPGDAERFEVRVTAPAEEGVYRFPTIQTYDDGEEVAWIDDPGTDRPAPRIQVGEETSEVELAEDATPHTDLAGEDDSTGDDTGDDSTGDDGSTGDDASDPAPSPTPSPTVVPERDEDSTEQEPAADGSGDTDEPSAPADDGGVPAWTVLLVALAAVGAALTLHRTRR